LAQEKNQQKRKKKTETTQQNSGWTIGYSGKIGHRIQNKFTISQTVSWTMKVPMVISVKSEKVSIKLFHVDVNIENESKLGRARRHSTGTPRENCLG
jgi:hypothetical protein